MEIHNKQGHIEFSVNDYQIVLKDKTLYINGNETVFIFIQILEFGNVQSSATWTREDFTIWKAEEFINNFFEERGK